MKNLVIIAIAAALLANSIYGIYDGGEAKAYSGKIKRFSSYEEFSSFMEEHGIYRSPDKANYNILTYGMRDEGRADKSIDFSKTNIQVEGVDEADTVKTDGKFIYKVINGKNGEVAIINAEKMELVSLVKLNEYIHGIFVSGNKLVIIAQEETPRYYMKMGRYHIYSPETRIWIYDISNKSLPFHLFNYTITATYLNSRMIDDWVYIVSLQNIYRINGSIELPHVKMNGMERNISADEIEYADLPISYYRYAIISAIRIDGNETEEKVFLTGDASNIYVSPSSIYITANYWNESERTAIYKFTVDGGDISFHAMADVMGYVLNQFSMDEYMGQFRIVTTSWENGRTANNVYIFDENLMLIGKLTGIAPGERIYSARFMGNKLYMVTFRQIDPLFVIDLANGVPKKLGYLKVSGASEYLHFYDDEHLIGFGFEATQAGVRTGLKITLFDVSDFYHPEEVANYTIKNAYSEASWEHHAFLFSRNKNLLVIPVDVYGNNSFSGIYVFNISLDGIYYRGRISHMPANKTYEYNHTYDEGNAYINHYLITNPGNFINITLSCPAEKEWVLDTAYDENVVMLLNRSIEEGGNITIYRYLFKLTGEGYAHIEMDLIEPDVYEKQGEFSLDISCFGYVADNNYRITRSLYINNTLYTFSNFMVKANNLEDLNEIALLDLG